VGIYKNLEELRSAPKYLELRFEKDQSSDAFKWKIKPVTTLSTAPRSGKMFRLRTSEDFKEIIKEIRKKMEANMGEKKYKVGDIIKIGRVGEPMRKGIIVEEYPDPDKQYRVYIPLLNSTGICRNINADAIVSDSPEHKLSGEELEVLFGDYCKSEWDYDHSVCWEECEIYALGGGYSCEGSAKQLRFHDEVMKILVAHKAQKEQEKEEKPLWKCSNPNCKNTKLGEDFSYCQKCGYIITKLIVEGEFEKDKKNKPIETERVWLARIIKGDPGDAKSKKEVVAEKILTRIIDFHHDCYFVRNRHACEECAYRLWGGGAFVKPEQPHYAIAKEIDWEELKR